MPRIPRKLLIDAVDVGVYHCISRCVRRAFLCGGDRFSGKNFDHRKQWIQDRLQFLAGQFGIDVLGFSLMSNHIHLVLRNRPDVVQAWSDDEVARRWWNLFPMRTDEHGNPAEPQESDLSMTTGNAARLEEVRSRLSSLSWFMRYLAEPIARRANREDECTGRFWEGRYKCQPILDESALTACMAYVDLNPIRAGIAPTPETSQFTSVFERIQAERIQTQAERAAAGVTADRESWSEAVSEAAPLKASLAEGSLVDARQEESSSDAGGQREGEDDQKQRVSPSAARAAWLSCFSLIPAANKLDSTESLRNARASNTGCLEMIFEDYLRLLDWTGRQMRSDKRGVIPADLAPIMTRLQVTEEGWLKLVTGFSRLFRRTAGTPPSLNREAAKHGRRCEGMATSRTVFV